MDKVDKLYQNYDILADATSKASDHEAEYLEILQCVKGETSEKMLACQFIPRFFKDFPHLADRAIDAQLDLLEDEDISIRKLAIKHLPSFCKDSKDYVAKIADILAQMLQSDDSSELATVHSALMTILKLDVKSTLNGLFSQITKINTEPEISTKEDEVICKRTIQFLCSKLRFLPPDLVTKEIEEYVLEECKKVIQVSAGEELLSLLSLLSNFKIAKTIPGQQALVDIVKTELSKDFNLNEPKCIIGFMQCVRQGALPYFSPFISSAYFVNYICEQILPKLDEVKQMDKADEITLEIIKLLAEISTFCIDLENNNECTEIVYHTLLEYIPLPPVIDVSENIDQIDEPNLQFTHIECLMYAFSQLAKNNTAFLIGPESADRLKDLKCRLQYLARGIQNCIKTVRDSLSTIKAEESATDENKVKSMALRTMTNINSLIKDLFRSPPSFKSVVTLSWKSPATAKVAAATGTKRELIEAPKGESKHVKRDSKAGRELYAPPGGKYSTNVKGYPRSRGSSYYPRGRGRRFY